METQRNDRPNPVFDDGKTFIGEITTYTEAHNLPVNDIWCICKSPYKIEKYKRNGCKIYFVDNGEIDNKMKYVAIVLYPNGDLIFWDMDDEKIEDNHIDDFMDTLSDEAKEFISKLRFERIIASNKTNELFYNPKHVLKFDEFVILEKFEV